MNRSDLKSSENSINKTQGEWSVETIAEQIFSDLNGAFTRSTIQEVLKEVIPKYETARIQTYVPIFIRRDAVNQLKSVQTLSAVHSVAINEAPGTNGNLAILDASPHRIDRNDQDKTIGAHPIQLQPAARG
jgi:hypothetical protein